MNKKPNMQLLFAIIEEHGPPKGASAWAAIAARLPNPPSPAVTRQRWTAFKKWVEEHHLMDDIAWAEDDEGEKKNVGWPKKVKDEDMVENGEKNDEAVVEKKKPGRHRKVVVAAAEEDASSPDATPTKPAKKPLGHPKKETTPIKNTSKAAAEDEDERSLRTSPKAKKVAKAAASKIGQSTPDATDDGGEEEDNVVEKKAKVVKSPKSPKVVGTKKSKAVEY